MFKKWFTALLLVAVFVSGSFHSHALEIDDGASQSPHQCLVCQGATISFDGAAPLREVFFHAFSLTPTEYQLNLPAVSLAAHSERAPPRG